MNNIDLLFKLYCVGAAAGFLSYCRASRTLCNNPMSKWDGTDWCVAATAAVFNPVLWCLVVFWKTKRFWRFLVKERTLCRKKQS